MPLSPGHTVGPYSVLEKLGEGGMGEVWKARDTRLGRIVALKFLPAEKLADQSRRQRFLQEAQAASALNHPNIVTIHDWVEQDGNYFLVMEFVPGKTLDRLMRRNGLSLRDTLSYATQIAGALSAAHAAGIVHRDVKPANIMVNDQGCVKVLDFGLAKLSQDGHVSQNEATLTARIATEEGLVAGSAPYMSPEQAEGKKLDARSDIFSFGAVLYEMVTGVRAFQGDTRASQMAAVLKSEPKPASQVAEFLPRELERIITRCLRKDLERRSHSIAEIRLELEEIKEESESGMQPIASVKPVPRPAWMVPALLAAVLGMGMAAWMATRSPGPAAPVYRLRQVTRDGSQSFAPAVSPDGKLIAYVSNRGGQRDLWIQPLAGGDPVRLTNTPAPEINPVFSHDGALIYYQRGDDIFAVRPIGGGERSVVSASGLRRFFDVSPDGANIVYGVSEPNLKYLESRLRIVPSSGGASRVLGAEPLWITTLLWSPGGNSLLVTVPERTTSVDSAPSEWRLIPASGGAAKVIEGLDRIRATEGASFLMPRAWLADGRIVFAAAGEETSHIWSVKVDTTGRVAEPPVRLTNGTGEFPGMPSADGRVIPFTNGSGVVTVYELGLGADRVSAAGEPKRLVQADGDAFFPVVTADGKKMVYVSTRMGNPDIWIRDLETGIDSPLVATPERETRGVISPDGSRLAFQRTADGRSRTFWMPLPRGNEEKICDDCRSVLGWTPDSTSVLVSTGKPEQMMLHDIATGKRSPTAEHPKNEIHDMAFSPDGRWLVFKVVESSLEHHVYVSPYVPGRATSPAEWIRISGGGFHARPFWSPDGNTLYFFHNTAPITGSLYAQPLDPSTKRPKGECLLVKAFDANLRPPTPSLVGYGLAGNRIILPLSQGRVNVWVAEQER